MSHKKATPSKRRRSTRGTSRSAGDLARLVPHRSTGGVNLPGYTETLEWESYLERLAIRTLSICVDVSAMRTQPEELELSDATGQSWTYTPDLCLTADGRTQYVEVKPLVRLLEPNERARCAANLLALKAKGHELRFLTDSALEVEPRASNAKLIQRYISHPVDPDTVAQLQAMVCAKPTTIGQALARLQDILTLVQLYASIAQGLVVLDWAQPLSRDARLYPAESTMGGLNFESLLASGRGGDLLPQLVVEGGPRADRLLAVERARHQLHPNSNPFGFW